MWKLLNCASDNYNRLHLLYFMDQNLLYVSTENQTPLSKSSTEKDASITVTDPKYGHNSGILCKPMYVNPPSVKSN